jgi:hypothetical protein
MNEGTSTRSVLVTLNLPPPLEERVIDWLLERADQGGFTSYPAHGHSSQHEHLSVAEQVRGHQRRLEFRIELTEAALDEFLADLSQRFGTADIYYSVVAALRSGHLGS